MATLTQSWVGSSHTVPARHPSEQRRGCSFAQLESPDQRRNTAKEERTCFCMRPTNARRCRHLLSQVRGWYDPVMRMPLLVGAVVVLVSRTALPCAGSTCFDFFQGVPRSGFTIPVNAPAIGVQRALFATRSPDGGTFVLPSTSQRPQVRQVFRQDGGVVLGGAVALPDVNSNVGVFVGVPAWQVGSTWRIEYSEPGTLGATCQADSEFIIGPAAPLPTVSSMVTELDSEWVPSSRTSCGGFPEAQLVRFRLSPTAEMMPWLPLARWELEVDGRKVSAAPFSDVPDAGLMSGAFFGQAYLPLNVLRVECNPTTPNSIGPGRHAVRLLALIEGIASPIPSNTVMVQVACTPSDGGRPDAGLPDASFWPIDDGGFPVPPDASTPWDGGGGSHPDASVLPPWDGGGGGAALDAGQVGGLDAGAQGTDAGTQPTPVVLDGGASMVSGPQPPGGCTSVPIAIAPGLVLALWLRSRRRADG